MCATDMTAPAYCRAWSIPPLFLQFFVSCLLLVDVRNSYHFSPSYRWVFPLNFKVCSLSACPSSKKLFPKQTMEPQDHTILTGNLSSKLPFLGFMFAFVFVLLFWARDCYHCLCQCGLNAVSPLADNLQAFCFPQTWITEWRNGSSESSGYKCVFNTLTLEFQPPLKQWMLI